MASPDPELKDGFTLPVWMKSRPNKDFSSFAASPPPPEDSFFIRYPDHIFGKEKTSDTDNISKAFDESFKNSTGVHGDNIAKNKDWSKHTKPCQQVLYGVTPINTSIKPDVSKSKPAGTDDGFKGAGAACGTSVVKVAQEMMQSSSTSRGFTVAAPSSDPEEPDRQHSRMVGRRGSKSLPVTPAHSPPSSPTTRRKATNRYFSPPFVPVDDSSNRSWFTTALLGLKKDLTTSTSTLAEEDSLENRLHVGSIAESVESLGPAPKKKESHLLSADPTPEPNVMKPKPKVYRPRPSELREMNFWSPTSM